MDKVADLLRELAAELGTTVEYLWPLLVKQTQVDWLGGMLTSLMGVGIGAVFAWVCRGAAKRAIKDDMGIDVVTAIVSGGVAFLVLVFSLGGVAEGLSSISDLLVPEAATVERLLEMVR